MSAKSFSGRWYNYDAIGPGEMIVRHSRTEVTEEFMYDIDNVIYVVNMILRLPQKQWNHMDPEDEHSLRITLNEYQKVFRKVQSGKCTNFHVRKANRMAHELARFIDESPVEHPACLPDVVVID